MRKHILTGILLIAYGGCIYAQSSLPSVWTLEDCIRYAKEQNISIQKTQMSLQSAGVDLEQAKAAYWPTLSLGNSESIRYTPYASGSEGVSADGTSMERKNNFIASGSLGLNLNWTVWNGSRQKTIDQQKVKNQISELSVAQTENEIVESIMLVFMRVQYAEEQVKVCESTLEVSQKQLERGEAMNKVGAMSKSDYAALVSQHASDQYNLISAQANLQNYQLQLKQLLELSADIEMALTSPEITDEEILVPLPSKNEVYNAALSSRPEIQSAELSIQSAELSIASAKSGYMPSIGLSASSSTSLSYANGGTNVAAATQIKEGWNNSVGLNISIPLVDGRQAKSAVEKAKIQKEQEELSLLEAQKNLRKSIESLWLDAQSSQLQYTAAKAKQEAAEESYNLIQEQFNVGSKHATELLQAKETLLSAQQALIQAKYMARYSINMLKYYQGTL